VLDCAIASYCPVPDGRLISRLADDLAGGWPAAFGLAPAICRDLLELLAGVSDGRPGQGRDHPVAAVLALAAAAVAPGPGRSPRSPGGPPTCPPACWKGCTGGAGPRGQAPGPPSKATIWRVVTGADAAALDAVTGSWLLARASAAGSLACPGHGGDDEVPLIPVRVDGKTVRGARNADGSQVHLLAALAGVRGCRRSPGRGGRQDERDPDDHPAARWPEPGRGGHHG
jgi:hypothetical protein